MFKKILKGFSVAAICIMWGLLCTTVVFNSCKVQFVPSKDTTIIAEVKTGASLTLDIYSSIAANPSQNYNYFINKYQAAEAIINDLLQRDLNRPHGGIIHSELITLQNNLLRLEAVHKSKGFLNTGEINAFSALCAGYWNIIRDQENHYIL